MIVKTVVVLVQYLSGEDVPISITNVNPVNIQQNYYDG